MARPHIRLKLPEQDRRILESWLRASKTDRVLAERAQIILACGQGLTATEVAERLSKRLLSVQMWRRRYLEQGVSGLEDRPRSGRPRKLSHANVRAILKATVERIPRESTYWSVRLMAEHSGVSKHQVAQIWKAADLKPHRVRNFKISNDPHFAEKVIDVVGLYMDPPDNALVLSVDEKTEIQALDRTQPMLQLRPGQIQRRTHDYKRHGTASLYAAFDVVTGEVMGRITNRHRAKEFLAFLRQIDQAVEPELDVHLILDNSRKFEILSPKFEMKLKTTNSDFEPLAPGSVKPSLFPEERSSSASGPTKRRVCARRRSNRTGIQSRAVVVDSGETRFANRSLADASGSERS